MAADEKQTVLIRDIPGDVIDWLESRAARNYRSRSGEIMAILTALARSDATLPGLGVGEMMPVARVERGTEAAVDQDGENAIGGES